MKRNLFILLLVFLNVFSAVALNEERRLPHNDQLSPGSPSNMVTKCKYVQGCEERQSGDTYRVYGTSPTNYVDQVRNYFSFSSTPQSACLDDETTVWDNGVMVCEHEAAHDHDNSALEGRIDSEQTARIAADTALGTRIDTVTADAITTWLGLTDTPSTYHPTGGSSGLNRIVRVGQNGLNVANSGHIVIPEARPQNSSTNLGTSSTRFNNAYFNNVHGHNFNHFGGTAFFQLNVGSPPTVNFLQDIKLGSGRDIILGSTTPTTGQVMGRDASNELAWITQTGGGGGSVDWDMLTESLVPDTDNSIDIGSSSVNFRELFVRNIHATTFEHTDGTSMMQFSSTGGSIHIGISQNLRKNSLGTVSIGQAASPFDVIYANQTLTDELWLGSSGNAIDIRVGSGLDTGTAGQLLGKNSNNVLAWINQATGTASVDWDMLTESLVPAADGGISLGNATGRFSDLYLTGDIHFGTVEDHFLRFSSTSVAGIIVPSIGSQRVQLGTSANPFAEVAADTGRFTSVHLPSANVFTINGHTPAYQYLNTNDQGRLRHSPIPTCTDSQRLTADGMSFSCADTASGGGGSSYTPPNLYVDNLPMEPEAGSIYYLKADEVNETIRDDNTITIANLGSSWFGWAIPASHFSSTAGGTAAETPNHLSEIAFNQDGASFSIRVSGDMALVGPTYLQNLHIAGLDLSAFTATSNTSGVVNGQHHHTYTFTGTLPDEFVTAGEVIGLNVQFTGGMWAFAGATPKEGWHAAIGDNHYEFVGTSEVKELVVYNFTNSFANGERKDIALRRNAVSSNPVLSLSDFNTPGAVLKFRTVGNSYRQSYTVHISDILDLTEITTDDATQNASNTLAVEIGRSNVVSNTAFAQGTAYIMRRSNNSLRIYFSHASIQSGNLKITVIQY